MTNEQTMKNLIKGMPPEMVARALLNIDKKKRTSRRLTGIHTRQKESNVSDK